MPRLMPICLSAFVLLGACTSSSTTSQSGNSNQGSTTSTNSSTSTTGGGTTGGSGTTGGTGSPTSSGGTSSSSTTTGAAQGPSNTCPFEVSAQAAPEALSQEDDGTYPRLTRLQGGDLLASFTRFVTNANTTSNQLIVSRSRAGQSAAEVGQIYSGVGDIDNAFVLSVPYVAQGATANRVVAAFRNHTLSNGAYTNYRLTVRTSDDEGATWAAASEILETVPPYGLWEPFLLNASDGSLQVYYSHETGPSNQYVAMKSSLDAGETWSNESVVANSNFFRNGIPSVVPYFDGQQNALLAVFESEDTSTGHFALWSAKSTDVGAHWQERTPVYTPATGHNAGAPQAAYLGKGSLIIAFMTDEDSIGGTWPDNAAVKVLTSQTTDPNAITWGGEYTVSPASTYWPAVLTDNDGNAVVAYANVLATLVGLTVSLACENP